MTATATRKTRKLVCAFDELGETQKENARERMRQSCAEDLWDTDFVFTDAKTAAAILGITFDTVRRDDPDIRWSGFNSQGDGASFVGSYSHSPNSSIKIHEEFPCDTTLHKIAQGLDTLQTTHKLLTGRRFTARITQDDNRYFHKYTMGVDLSFPDSEEDYERDDIDLEKRVLDLMRDFAQWIYDRLEEEYEYRLSDEAIEETIRANDYKFQSATGRMV